uniref:Uncharacterized protein n=1 Tax=Sphaerodactylus townsendi TaxID=933632 RepID=A0ACB8F3Z5_9SAUR
MMITQLASRPHSHKRTPPSGTRRLSYWGTHNPFGLPCCLLGRRFHLEVNLHPAHHSLAYAARGVGHRYRHRPTISPPTPLGQAQMRPAGVGAFVGVGSASVAASPCPACRGGPGASIDRRGLTRAAHLPTLLPVGWVRPAASFGRRSFPIARQSKAGQLPAAALRRRPLL